MPDMLLTTAVLALAQGTLPPLPPRHTGLVYVSGFTSNNVVELAPDGTWLRTFGTANTQRPRGVAVDDLGNVVVVNQGTSTIQVFDLEGNVVREVTHPDLDNGTGISRHGDGHWLVGNFWPGSVIEFDADWQHVRTITNAAMSGVNCVSVEADGSLSVTDAFHGAVHLFDVNRQYVRQVDHATFASPMSIARDSAGSHFVSNGGGLVSKFDADWSFVTSFGQGHVSQPQGILVDEDDVLTITNFSSNVVNRFDVDGNHLESFPLVGASVGRNAAYQTSPFALAMAGAAEDARGVAQPILTVNGSSGGPLGHVTIDASGPVRVELARPPAVASGSLGAVVYAWGGAATPSTVAELPGASGLLSHAPPFMGGDPSVLTNSFGRTDVFGSGVLAPVTSPGIVVDRPGGVGRPLTLTLQAFVDDGGPFPVATNAVVVEFQ